MSKTNIIRVEAGRHKKFLEFLAYKQLIYFFVWRDFKAKYKQTALGVSWALLEPFLFSGIIGLVLTRRAGLSFGFEASDVVVIFIGFSLWQLFQGTFAGAANSINSNKPLLKKIYFSKFILILSTVASKSVDFFLQAITFTALLLLTSSPFNVVGFAFLLLGVLYILLCSIGAGLILSPLSVKYRDVSVILPLIMRVMFFTAPIWYPFSLIPEKLQTILLFNPIVAVLEFSRIALFGSLQDLDPRTLLYPLVTIVVLFIVGVPWFKRKEGELTDYM